MNRIWQIAGVEGVALAQRDAALASEDSREQGGQVARRGKRDLLRVWHNMSDRRHCKLVWQPPGSLRRGTSEQPSPQ